MDSYDDYLFNVLCNLYETYDLDLMTSNKIISDKQEMIKYFKKKSIVGKVGTVSLTLDFLVKDKKITMLEMQQFKNSILTFKKITDIEKDIASLKDSQQNTTDIVNLFTDIDKNRTNLEEQNKEINKRLDKIESTLEQILVMLKKIDF